MLANHSFALQQHLQAHANSWQCEDSSQGLSQEKKPILVGSTIERIQAMFAWRLEK